MIKAQFSNLPVTICLERKMLGDALRMIRVFHDMSQREAAVRLQIAPSYLSEIESGKKEPTIQLLRRYSEELKIPMSSILFFAEHMEDGASASRLRVAVSGKVLALLKFIAARSGRDAA